MGSGQCGRSAGGIFEHQGMMEVLLCHKWSEFV